MESIALAPNGLYNILCGQDGSIENFAIFPWREGLHECLSADKSFDSIVFNDRHTRLVLVQNINISCCYELCEKFGIQKFPYSQFDSDGMTIEFHLRKFLDNPEDLPVVQRYGLFLETEKLKLSHCIHKENISILCAMCNIRVPFKTYIQCYSE